MRLKERVRVGIATSNFWPELTGIGQVTTEFARFLADAGASVEVATALPYYPEWRIQDGYSWKHNRVEHSGAVVIHRSWHYVRPDPNTLARALHEITLCLFAIPNLIGLALRADVFYVVTPDLLYAFTASVIGKLFGRRPILIVQDILPEAAVELGLLRNHFVIRALAAIARLNYGFAERIFTVGEGMRKRISATIRRPGKVSVFANTFDSVEFEHIPLNYNKFRTDFVPVGVFAVVHSGNMGEKQDLDLLLRAATLLQEHNDVRFYVFGDGAAKSRFLASLKSAGLKNVFYHPLQSRELVPHVLAGADALLIAQRAEIVDLLVPSKLVTAMAAGAQIVAACARGSETWNILDESGAGVTVPAGDEAALAAAILRLKTSPSEFAHLRARAREYATQHFEREKVYNRLIAATPGFEKVTARESASEFA